MTPTVNPASGVAAAPVPSESRKTATRAKVAKTNGPGSRPTVAQFCRCGCGARVKKYFAPGHDSKFKSILLQIERGAITLEQGLKKSVRDQYTWKRRGQGMIPTRDYRGDAYTPRS